MRLGLGLYRHMLDENSFAFARQCGCSELIIHLANYYTGDGNIVKATDETENYGVARAEEEIWSLENLRKIVTGAKARGLGVYGIENFSPADWYDILLDGPKKEEQMEGLKRIIRNVGKAGIRCFGYNFSLAGVWGHSKTTEGRGGAESTCFDAGRLNLNARIPKGEIWNMTYEKPANKETGGENKTERKGLTTIEYEPAKTDMGYKNEYIKDIGYEELWGRLKWFLERILPVAEEAGVIMALHPDDPPMPFLRSTPRLVYQPDLYRKVLKLVESPSNAIDFCMGSIQEMTEGNVYEALEEYASIGKVAYAHVRNVRGKVPNYTEVFVDNGDIDIKRTLQILHRNQFNGVLIPDHTPQLTCDAPWHAGMAYALGFLKGQLMEFDGKKLNQG